MTVSVTVTRDSTEDGDHHRMLSSITIVVVELLEVHLDAVQRTSVDAGGSVGLVGDGEVERRRAVRCL